MAILSRIRLSTATVIDIEMHNAELVKSEFGKWHENDKKYVGVGKGDVVKEWQLKKEAEGMQAT